jgi:hypothetical protein
MAVGPLESHVIGFEGSTFDGSIAREVGKVVDKGIIRLVDVVLLTRDVEGAAVVVKLGDSEDLSLAPFKPLLAATMDLFTPEDIDEIIDSLPLNASGLVLLFEHRWSEDLKDAIGAAGGFLVNRVVMPPEVLGEVEAALETAPLPHEPTGA